MHQRSLRHAVKLISGQDVYLCRECQLCDLDSTPDMDVPLTTIVQMIMFDDEEVLTCRTVWSDQVVLRAAHACKRGLKLGSILQALREEARNRGIP